MLPQRNGSFHLLRLAGINVYVHWSWFLMAAYEISSRTDTYSSWLWNVYEYLALFLFVTMHEFGHALACRQTGGQANEIVLWPLGGVAFVAPPQRPGAQLWSIAAGPLVNLVLLPVLWGLFIFLDVNHLQRSMPDTYHFVHALAFINTVLLVFNLLPIYPLDGGQILRSLLWFVLGRARSLMAASIIGFAGVVALGALALFAHAGWYVVLAVFVFMRCWSGLQQARMLSKVASAPRRDGFMCPHCQTAPPVGTFWGCANCRQTFDTFATLAACPNCHAQFGVTSCPECGKASPMGAWTQPPPLPGQIIG